MKLTRIVALGVMALGLLTVAPVAVAPVTALASTPGPPVPFPIPGKCQVPPPRSLAMAGSGTFAVAPVPGPVVICCAVVKRVHGPVRHPLACQGRRLVFDMPAFGRDAHEVIGPRLRGHELIFFRGRIYEVASVHGRTFTMDTRGRPFVNRGPRIHDGKALVLALVRVICPPGK